MELSEEVLYLLRECTVYAHNNGYEYITPEMVLMMMLRSGQFSDAFEECGGDAGLLEEELENYLTDYVDRSENAEVAFSDQASHMIDLAGKSAYNSGNDKISLRHLVHAILSLENSYAAYYIEKQDVTAPALLQVLSAPEENRKQAFDKTSEDISIYAPCLNDTLKDVNPLIGREKELERTIQILCRKDKNNPLHIGEPGVGKTAVTYGLVQKLQKNDVPDSIKGARVFLLDLGSILAGTQYRGDFEKRLKKILTAISMEEKPIIYIDEIHNLSGAGAVGESSFDASNMIKPYLAEGKVRFIGATTYEEYKKHFEKNRSLARRFQNVEISEPSEEEAIKILNGLKTKYEDYHGVKFAPDVIAYSVRMSAKYINERFLPDKAIDLMDEAGSYRKLHPLDKKIQTVNKDVINEILTKICRVPIETVQTDDMSGLKTLEKRLKDVIFGQDEAIGQVVNAVKYSKAGLSEDDKPLASLLFVGPTGVGKTEIAKCLAKELGVKLIRFDMSEYKEKHSVAKLIGSPAGYVGYEEGGILTEAIRKTPSSVLLLDEIEKAHPDIFNVLLQVMDDATLTDNQGRKADFRNVIIIMTSNAGSSMLGKRSIGFTGTLKDAGVIDDAVKNTFQPEFRNRLNRIVVFNSMSDKMASLIVDKKIKELSDRLTLKNIALSADKKARDLVKKKGIDSEFGARQIDRVIRNEIKPLFVDEMLFGRLKNGGKLKLSAKEDSFIISSS